jgi:hypothetical protein
MERTLLRQFQWTSSTEAWSNRVEMGTALLRRSVAKALERKRQGFGLRPTKSEGKGGGKDSIKYIN